MFASKHPAQRRAVIGYYDDSLWPGGTTRYLFELIEGLDRERFQPLFFALRWRSWQRTLLERGVDVVTPTGRIPAHDRIPNTPADPVPARPWSRLRPTWLRMPAPVAWTLGHVRELGQLVQLFRSVPVDLVHSNNAGAEVAPVAARLAGVPRVLATWHVHSDYDLEQTRQGIHYRTLEFACMRSLDHAIAVSQATKLDWMTRCHLGATYDPRVSVIHNGVVLERLKRRRSPAEARAALGLPADSLVLGSIGKLAPIKGFDVLAAALPSVLAAAPRLHVVIAGNGPDHDTLLAYARARGFGERLHLVGFIEDVRNVLEALDIYVQPSRREAHPMALLEAGALGLPAVVSTAGGMPETVVHGETGLVVPIEDAAALGAALRTLATDEVLRTRMGERARERTTCEFSHERMVARTISVYDRLLDDSDARVAP